MSHLPPAGQRDKFVEIESESFRVEHGNPKPGWSTFARVWVKLEPLQGREAFQVRQSQPEVSHKLSGPYLPGLTSAMRVKLAERIFSITSVIDPDEQHEAHVLLCVEQTGGT
jgi:SPP1 family predicted phage head-tail adaptor